MGKIMVLSTYLSVSLMIARSVHGSKLGAFPKIRHITEESDKSGTLLDN